MNSMLEHLLIYPRGGLCNRMRAIASAKRLCGRAGARCTIAWDWGDYRAVFDDHTPWIPYDREHIIPADYHCIRHLGRWEGGTHADRLVPTTTHSRLAVTSHFVFGAVEEPLLDTMRGYEWPVFSWFPKPHPSVLERVSAFRQLHFPARVAGIHIRRTDNERAIAWSPYESFIREANRAVKEGFHLFLGTDNAATLDMMRQLYGSKLIYRGKASETTVRWPRKSLAVEDILDDLTDLWLLAACEYVVGSAASSYSRVAILLNGSSRSKAI
jgi:hypothetical protein